MQVNLESNIFNDHISITSDDITDQDLSTLIDGDAISSITGSDTSLVFKFHPDIFNGLFITSLDSTCSIYFSFYNNGTYGWIGSDGEVKNNQVAAIADPIIISNETNNIIFSKGIITNELTIYFIGTFDISEVYFNKKTSGGLIQEETVDTVTITPRAVTDITIFSSDTVIDICDDFYGPNDDFFVYSMIGDGYDYLIDADAFYNSITTVNNNEEIDLYTILGVLNADNATLIKDQWEDHYNDSGDNGDFDGGTGHNKDDIITLSCGSTVRVDQALGNIINQFMITLANTGDSFGSRHERRQISTTGSGTGFVLYPAKNNVVDWDNCIIIALTISTIFRSIVLGDSITQSNRNIASWHSTLENGTQYNIYITARKERTGTSTVVVESGYRYINLLKIKR